jgi:hypothetical protein
VKHGSVHGTRDTNWPPFRLRVSRRQARILCKASHHSRANFVGVMEANIISGQPGRARTLCDPVCRLMLQPIRKRAASARFALADFQLLMRRQKICSSVQERLLHVPTDQQAPVRPGPGPSQKLPVPTLRMPKRRAAKYLSDPAPIFFLFDFNFTGHKRNLDPF